LRLHLGDQRAAMAVSCGDGARPAPPHGRAPKSKAQFTR
jgi:hypothetical protein